MFNMRDPASYGRVIYFQYFCAIEFLGTCGGGLGYVVAARPLLA
jgi:hypothetical protein